MVQQVGTATSILIYYNRLRPRRRRHLNYFALELNYYVQYHITRNIRNIKYYNLPYTLNHNIMVTSQTGIIQDYLDKSIMCNDQLIY